MSTSSLVRPNYSSRDRNLLYELLGACRTGYVEARAAIAFKLAQRFRQIVHNGDVALGLVRGEVALHTWSRTYITLIAIALLGRIGMRMVRVKRFGRSALSEHV